MLCRAVTLSELVDLEAQLARDRDVPADALEIRDRSLLGAVRPGDRRRGELLRRWLAGIRERDPAALFPGRAVSRALRALEAALAVAGLVLGWGAASALFHYAGEHPVNVWDVLLLLVGVQVLLLLLLLAALALPLAGLGSGFLGPIRAAVAAAYPRLAARLGRGERAEEWRALWHRLRSRRSLYARIEPWVLLGTTQIFAVAFNVGALLGCLRLVVFSDLAFAWSTTLVELDAGRFHALVSAIAWPWSRLWPDAVPPLSLVEATRYSRLEGAYLEAGSGRAADPALVGGWWRFLIAAITTYGLVPRAVALAVGRARQARLLARLPLDDAEVARVLRRLSEPHVETRAVVPEAGAPPEPGLLAPSPVPAPGRRCAVVLWRDVPPSAALQAAVARHAGCEVGALLPAGGRDGGETPTGVALDGADPVLVVAEGFEAPDRAALRLVRELRLALGPRRHVVVVLVEVEDGRVGPAPEAEVRIWRDGLARLQDPYVGVEPLRGTR